MERINVNLVFFGDPWIQLLLIFALAVVFSSALELMESDSQRVFLTLCTSQIFVLLRMCIPSRPFGYDQV